jgi:hypothetical protein
MNENSSMDERLQDQQVESSRDALSYRQIGEIHGEQWGEQPGDLLQLQGKCLFGLPPWLGQILDRDFGGDFPSEWGWIDHWGSSGETSITEPYGLTELDVQQIVGFSTNYGLQCRIGAESQHFPTRTVFVQIWPL